MTTGCRVSSLLVCAGIAACALRGRESERPSEPRAPRSTGPLWIWTGEDEEASRAWLRREFELASLPARAELSGSADDAAALYLNGELVAEAVDWEEPFRVDVTRALRAGPNVLAAACRNHGGPGALWCELVLTLADGTERRLASDAAFRASARELPGWSDLDAGPGWTRAREIGPLGVEPWGAQTEFVDGTPGSALPAEELEVAEGFRAELLYSVPRGLQGSWVSMTFDERGRLITSDQFGPLYRVTLREGETPLVEEIELPIGEAHGLLCAFGALYVVVSSDRFQSGLYRVRDTDGDDRYDDVECLKELEGSGEHGPHGVVAGPDGESLYVVIGNHTELPDGITRYRMPPVWGEDQLLLREPDPGGHAVDKMAPGGVVLRTDPDGEEWELVAGGLRNAYDIAFDEQGELYTYDSDMEWDVGLPWYRPTRILHVVSGADFGWRNGSGKWPADYPDTLPSVVDLGRGSPTGIAHGAWSWFPGSWKRCLYAADWSGGAIVAVATHRQEDDSGRFASLVRGRPAPVADLAFGPDGALYFVTGGRNTQSGLYRIRASIMPGLWSPHGGDALDQRRRALEAFHGVPDSGALDVVWPDLEARDPSRPHAARTVLEGRAPDLWQERALAEERPVAAIQAVLALARTADRQLQPRILERTLALLDLGPDRLVTMEEKEWLSDFPDFFDGPLAHYNKTHHRLYRDYKLRRLALLRILELAFIRMGRPDAELAARIETKLQSMFPNEDPRLDRELVQLLVYLESAPVIEKALDLIARAPTQEDALAMGWPLRVMKAGWTKDTRSRYFRWMSEVVPTYEGGESFRGYMDAMLGDAQSQLTEEDLDALALEFPPVTWRPGFPNIDRPFVRAWTMSDLLPELARLAPDAAGSPVDDETERDLERGAEVFSEACLACHRVGTDGGSTGPDLTSAGGRFSPRDLVESILAPSHTISDQYRDQEVWTTDDRAWVGRILRQDDTHVVVRTTDQEVIELPRAEVAEIRPHPLSRMPEALLDTYDIDEILDLVAFVLASREPERER